MVDISKVVVRELVVSSLTVVVGVVTVVAFVVIISVVEYSERKTILIWVELGGGCYFWAIEKTVTDNAVP